MSTNIKNGILPEDILPDHINQIEINSVGIRKGSVVAVLANIELLEDESNSYETKQNALQVIKSLVPGLIAAGMHKHVIWKNLEVQGLFDHELKK